MLLDPLGLQTTSGPAATGDPASDKCCSAAHQKNLFGQVGAGGIVVCCNGDKVACALEYSDPRLTTSGKLAQKLWIDCTFKPQYFLTGADGPWGSLDWTYERIGNRLSDLPVGTATPVISFV